LTFSGVHVLLVGVVTVVLVDGVDTHKLRPSRRPSHPATRARYCKHGREGLVLFLSSDRDRSSTGPAFGRRYRRRPPAWRPPLRTIRAKRRGVGATTGASLSCLLDLRRFDLLETLTSLLFGRLLESKSRLHEDERLPSLTHNPRCFARCQNSWSRSFGTLLSALNAALTGSVFFTIPASTAAARTLWYSPRSIAA
jgi:hypothetical protein